MPDAGLGEVYPQALLRAARKATSGSTRLFSYRKRKKRSAPAPEPDADARIEEADSVALMTTGPKPPICSETTAVECFHASQGQGLELWKDFANRINGRQVTQLGEGVEHAAYAYEKWYERARYLNGQGVWTLSSVLPFLHRAEDARAGQAGTTSRPTRSYANDPDLMSPPRNPQRQSVPVTPATSLGADAPMSSQERTSLKSSAADARKASTKLERALETVIEQLEFSFEDITDEEAKVAALEEEMEEWKCKYSAAISEIAELSDLSEAQKKMAWSRETTELIDELREKVAKGEAAVRQLAAGKRKRKSDKKKAKASAKKQEKSKLAGANRRIAALSALRDTLEVENDTLREQIEVLQQQLSPDAIAKAESFLDNLKIFEEGRYTDTVRLIYYTLLAKGTSTRQVQGVVSEILTILGVPFDRLPGKTTAIRMNAERGFVMSIDATAKLLHVKDHFAAFSSDEATKYGHSRFVLGAFINSNGPGSKIVFVALGVVDMPGGLAIDEAEAIEFMLAQLAAHENLFRQIRAKIVETTVGLDALDPKVVADLKAPTTISSDTLHRKGGATQSDTASTQQKTNRLEFSRIVTSSQKVDPEYTGELLRQFKCFLHKVINFCKATHKSMKVGWERDVRVIVECEEGGDVSTQAIL
jgi:hypothetical protein